MWLLNFYGPREKVESFQTFPNLLNTKYQLKLAWSTKYHIHDKILLKVTLSLNNTILRNNQMQLIFKNGNTRTICVILFWCLYCQLGTGFTYCAVVSIVDFDLANSGWSKTGILILYRKLLKNVIDTKHIKNVTILPNFKKIYYIDFTSIFKFAYYTKPSTRHKIYELTKHFVNKQRISKNLIILELLP